jgi:asparagine synthase (glutamine-hydrolysing)
MCGFAGVIERGPRAESGHRLEAALQCLMRRGPDGGGTEVVACAGWTASLGHRRLKIIDLDDRSAQPFTRGALTALYNGEIYNYLELRDELRALGHEFRTESDTEVLLAAWEQWGVGALDRLDGMFALALLDRARGTLLLARDAFGEKPLFVAAADGRVAFASTSDAVVALLGDRKPAVSAAFIEAFLTLGFAPAPLTAWVGIEKLAAGEFRQLDLTSGAWTGGHVAAVDLLDEPSQGRQFDPVEFESLLVGSLERRLRADVPVALLLSGGIDSAYLAALLRRRLDRHLLAVTIRDRLDSTAEVDRAARVCAVLGIEHRIVAMPARPLHELVAEALPAMDEPMGDPAFPMLLELFAHVPPELRVVLTGDGADELFLSYSSFRRLLAPRHGLLASVAAAVTPMIARTGTARANVLWRRVAERTVMAAAVAPGERFRVLAGLAGWTSGTIGSWSAGMLPEGRDATALYRHSLRHELPEYLLVKSDRAAMRHSFESRAPYLNRDLLRYVLQCDPATVGLGQKRHIMSRLDAALGADLHFTKRGFFASGQDQLTRVRHDWHPAMRDDRFRDWRRDALDLQRMDGLSYYRLHVLNTWLVTQCA